MDFSIFGYLAAICTAVSFLPQAIKTVKTKNTEGLSLTTYVFLFFKIIKTMKKVKPVVKVFVATRGTSLL